MSSIKEKVDRIIEDGVLTEEEHEEFMEAIYEDGQVDDEESEQISRVFGLIKEGKLKVVDKDRQEADAKRSKDAVKDIDLDDL